MMSIIKINFKIIFPNLKILKENIIFADSSIDLIVYFT